MSTEPTINNSDYISTASVMFAHPISLLERDNEIMKTANMLMAQNKYHIDKEAILVNYNKMCANMVAIKLLKGEIIE